ncbi:hypothetical protein [Actinomycetospora sp. TBRC 11914]|uniref:hypothetical protein n=1 Tax=Actinomycetospora sp. TBRC 11914 TaxID=2729387 RepID=UPI001B7D5769|nr:hypothetical protein [Actinomycetospora sp. TBRC 11914]
MAGCTLRLVHTEATVDTALELAAAGLHATEIGRRLGVPKSTVQYWCRGGRRLEPAADRCRPCPRCHGAPLAAAAYAYLLGTYLGDGHITEPSATTEVLAIYCSDDWPGISAESEHAMRAVLPRSNVSRAPRSGSHALRSHSRHWLCLFPQHGPGTKHTRSIVLEPWQRSIVGENPGLLLRGLFHSDGCRNLNWTQKRTEKGVVRYEYARYLFSNKSEDILAICEAALDSLDIAHRRARWDVVSVARRAAVARLDEFVGPKY